MEADRPVVVLVDDDVLFREAFSENLKSAGWSVLAFADPFDAEAYLCAGERCDVAVFDQRMPAISGLDLIDRVRKAGVEVPVVLMTAYGSQTIEERALDCSALDFLDKSRTPSILMKRLQLIVNGCKTGGRSDEPEEIVQVGSLVVNLQLQRAFWRGRRVPLTVTEFRIVTLLASRPGQDVTYRRIYDEVHGKGFAAGDGEEGYRTNVRSLIRRIRNKFRDLDPEFEEIENFQGFGYRWRPTIASRAMKASA